MNGSARESTGTGGFPLERNNMRQRVLLAIANLITSYASLVAVTGARPSTRQRTQSNNHGNISELLDNLLRGYDNSVRPDFGGPPATVEVDIMVRSMGPISEVDMTYSMDCYFRQSWVDRRLAFQGGKETLALSISMLARIWKPDTYFYNGKQSYLHTITSPNKFVRLYQDGRVLYSSSMQICSGAAGLTLELVLPEADWEILLEKRQTSSFTCSRQQPHSPHTTLCRPIVVSSHALTIKAGCPMNLEDFPMDTQRCPLKFGSFGYTTRDVVYKWNSQRQVAIAEDMKLSQFDLVANPTANQSNAAALSQTEYSMLLVSFHLQRHMGNFLIQVYGPCVLLVVLSWVSFWLNREATADRVSLGITTVLTMTFLGLEARTDLPKVPYPTALDFFVFLSFAFIFATIIQFAVVHYFTKYGSGECYFSSDLSDTDSSSDEEIARRPRKRETIQRKSSVNSSGRSCGSRNFAMNGDGIIEVIPLSALPDPDRRRSGGQWQLSCVPCSPPPPLPPPPKRVSTRRRHRRAPRYNSVSKIDRASRVVFPLLFLAINVFYWWSYLSRSERIS